jgi:hypothetical protein
MKNYKISINPLMDFSTSTEAKKARIIRDQKNPNPFRVGWYQTPRACIKKSIVLGGELNPIVEGMKRLNDKVVTKKQQQSNKHVSMEAMHRYLSVSLPKVFKNHNFELIKEREIKSTFLKGVEIIVSPDLIFKIKHNGECYLGAVKLHISKGNVFNIQKSSNVATLIHKYLSELSDKYDAKVIPEFCFSYDVFAGRFVTAKKDMENSINEIIKMCEEVKLLWNVA